MNSPVLAQALLTSFGEPAAEIADAAVVAPEVPWPSPIGPDVTVAHHHPRRVPLEKSLTQRRSARLYAPDPVPAGTLMPIVAAGVTTERAAWPGEQLCCPLRTAIVALRVGGLTPGIYLPDAGLTHLTPLMALDDPAECRDLVLQKEFADAAAIVAVFGDVDSAVKSHGGHGYRTLMSRAGMAMYGVWLDAVAAGLVGSVFAGFLPAAIRRPLRCDGVSRQQLFAVAVGVMPHKPLV